MRSLLLALPVLLLGACADDERVDAGGDATSTTPVGDQRYEVSGTVLESTEHGPELCLGGVADSYPPQCTGLELIGWDWDAVDGEEAASGTTWGTYHVVGTYADDTFSITEPPGPPEPPDGGDTDFASPCPEPEGGWAVVDPATATEAGLQAAMSYAAAQPDYAESWVDQSINPAMAEGVDPEEELLTNDPTQLVLNVRFTGDLARHEAELREVWGGSLCVSDAERTGAELAAIQEALADVPGFLSSGRPIGNHVALSVVLDDGLQERLDRQYGEGAVTVTSALRPVG